MTVQVELWALLTFGVGLLVAFFTGMAGVARYTLAQMDKRLEERFLAQQEARKEGQKRLAEQLSGIDAELGRQDQAREIGKRHWDDRFSDLDRMVADHRERIGKLEATVDKGPTHEDLSDLHARITDLGQSVSTLAGEFKGANHTLELIHSFLLNGGKG